MNHKSLILSVKIELVLESTKFDFFPEFYHELFKHTANLKDFSSKQLQLYLNSTSTILVLLISSPISLSQQLSNHIIFMPFKINWKYQIIMVYCMCVCMFSCVWFFVILRTSQSDSSVHGIFYARILEWVVISFSRGSSLPRDQTRVSCIGRWTLYHLSH